MHSLPINQRSAYHVVQVLPCSAAVRLQHIAISRQCCLHKGVQTSTGANMDNITRSVSYIKKISLHQGPLEVDEQSEWVY